MSAKTPPNKSERKATVPYVENNVPSSRFDRSNTSKKVGLKTLARTYGNMYIDSAARINIRRYL